MTACRLFLIDFFKIYDKILHRVSEPGIPLGSNNGGTTMLYFLITSVLLTLSFAFFSYRWWEKRKFFPWGTFALFWAIMFLLVAYQATFMPPGPREAMPMLLIGIVLGGPVGVVLAEETDWGN